MKPNIDLTLAEDMGYWSKASILTGKKSRLGDAKNSQKAKGQQVFR